MADQSKKAPATKAERVAWMTRTSDVVGSHMKNDLDSYLTLIRRKIQERCATTQDLITQIRRTKIGDSVYVTPNEFRFTLIKFGIILPQPLVDRIFNVFDSDRSGTMDFDEFAMWIMNSEFKPVNADVPKGVHIDTPTEVLRRKFNSCMVENPDVFAVMKKKISYLEFVSEVSRTTGGSTKISENEARQVFMSLDTKNSGFIDTAMLKPWCATGSTTPLAAPARTTSLPDLQTAINRVSVRNSKQMEKCFSHITIGSGIRIPFEEFRRCLVQNGLGKDVEDCKDLFRLLGGDSGAADIDVLLKALIPMHLPSNPKNEISKKKADPAYIGISRADRHLRDAMRKSYLDVKAEIVAKDIFQSGYIDAEELHAIILKYCMAVSFQDFRLITQQIPATDGGSKISWSHFLNVYNPLKAPHQLSAASSLKDLSSTAPLLPSPSREDEEGFGRASGQIRPLTSSYSSPALTASGSSTAAGETRELRKVWKAALAECQRSDPDGAGVVSRNTFISALDSTNNGEMTPEAMNKLADSYVVSSGLIDYSACFRDYLFNLSASFGSIGPSAFRAPEGAKSRDQKASHPWDFKYGREKHQLPYWYMSRHQARESRLEDAPSRIAIPNPQTKSAHDLNDTEKQALLEQYPAKVLAVCSKCYEGFVPVWKDLRNDLTRAQIVSQRGSILTSKFLAILELYGVRLSKSEIGTIIRSFRGMGIQDVVKFDEFLRVCLIVKSSHK